MLLHSVLDINTYLCMCAYKRRILKAKWWTNNNSWPKQFNALQVMQVLKMNVLLQCCLTTSVSHPTWIDAPIFSRGEVSYICTRLIARVSGSLKVITPLTKPIHKYLNTNLYIWRPSLHKIIANIEKLRCMPILKESRICRLTYNIAK